MPNIPDDRAVLAVLEALSRDSWLDEEYVLKGGNALKYAYASPRASVDLDLSAKEKHPNQEEKQTRAIQDEFCERLGDRLKQVATEYGFAKVVVQSSKIRPQHKNPRRFPALEIKVGYTERRDREPPFSDVVKLEITLNEVVCEDEHLTINDTLEVHVSSLEDILAEKLRSLLQQVIRNRNRPQDVFDIWFFRTFASGLDLKRISSYLQKKCDDKDITLSKERFRNPEVRERAAVDYDRLEERLPSNVPLPDFDEAFEEVIRVVEELDIPE